MMGGGYLFKIGVFMNFFIKNMGLTQTNNSVIFNHTEKFTKMPTDFDCFAVLQY